MEMDSGLVEKNVKVYVDMPYTNSRVYGVCVCSDVDECSEGTQDATCHTCFNLFGSYTCICNEGYVLENSKYQSCIGQYIG